MPKLPAGKLARHAYLDLIANVRGLIRIGGPWLLLAWAVLLLGESGGFLAALANLAVTLGVAAIAVAWHRHILLGEPLSQRMAPLDARVARYFALTVLIAVIMSILPLLALYLSGGGAPSTNQAGGALIVMMAVVFACLYATLRIQLVFPAIAIGDATVSLARSWELTRGNGWRLVGGLLIVTMPVAMALLILAYFLGQAAATTGSIALLALADLATVANAWLQAPLIASFLSYAFLWFKQQQPV